MGQETENRWEEETSKGEETSRGWKCDGSGEVEAIDAATERREAGEDGHQRGARTPGSSRQDQDPFPPLLPCLLPTAQPEHQGKLNDAKWTPEGIFFSMFFGASPAALKNCFEATSCISELWLPVRTVSEERGGKAGDGILCVVKLFHPENAEVLVNKYLGGYSH